MAQDHETDRTAGGGWTPLPEPPAGLPEAEFTRIRPLGHELEELGDHIARTLARSPENEEAKAMRFVIERIRRRIWEGTAVIEEATPQALARQLGVSAQTIRNWCVADKVRYRRQGTHYYVDVASARSYAALA